jgi:hypothetical protein
MFIYAKNKKAANGWRLFLIQTLVLASGDVHGDFETETQVRSSGLGPHGESPLN